MDRKIVIAAVSDLHRQHVEYTPLISSLAPDITLMAGDFTIYNEQHWETLLKWLKIVSKLTNVVMTFGNHDSWAQENLDRCLEETNENNINLLINSSCIVNGLNIWGSPNALSCSPNKEINAFTSVESELVKVYSKIPNNTDILLTHTPPKFILDDGHGSLALSQRLNQIKPKLHVFGHIHHRVGTVTEDGTVFVNASSIGSIDRGPYSPATIEINGEDITVAPPYEF